VATGKRSFTIPRVAALTCTGGRDRAFHMCKGYVARQSKLPDEWIIVDDCLPRQTPPEGAWRIYPEPAWSKKTGHTLARNMIAGLEAAMNLDGIEIVTIFEDDDWYSPVYLEEMTKALMSRYKRGVRIVGEMNTIYYNVRTRTWLQNWHPTHASLCSVTFHVDVLEEVIEIIKTNMIPTIDHQIFLTVDPKKTHLETSNLVLGIKGLPDVRVGKSNAHKDISGRFVKDDFSLSSLTAFIGDDADLYAGFFEDREPPDIGSLNVLPQTDEPTPKDRVLADPYRHMNPSQKRYAQMRDKAKKNR